MKLVFTSKFEYFMDLVQHMISGFIFALLSKMSLRNRLCAVSDVVHNAIGRATGVGTEEPEGKVYLIKILIFIYDLFAEIP